MNSMLALLPDGDNPGFLFNFLFLQQMPLDAWIVNIEAVNFALMLQPRNLTVGETLRET